MGFIQQLQTKSNSFGQIEKGILYTISDQRSINMPTVNYTIDIVSKFRLSIRNYTI